MSQPGAASSSLDVAALGEQVATNHHGGAGTADDTSHHVRDGAFDIYDIILIVFFAAVFIYSSKRAHG